MDSFDLDPALAALARTIPVPQLRRPVVRRAARRAAESLSVPRIPGVRVSELSDETLRARVYSPEATPGPARPALLWMHGGGFVVGAPRQDERFLADTAAELGIVVVSAAYRLAPEHLYPAALDDVAAVWGYLQRNAARHGIDPARVAIGGQSAGGGLAASLAQRLCDEGGVQPVAQWLMCPMLDDRTAADLSRDLPAHPVWTNDLNAYAWGAYLGIAPGAPSAPGYAVPARRAKLGGLPSAWIDVGDADLFHDEDVAYACRLGAACVDVSLLVVRGAPHAYETWGYETRVGQDSVAAARTWLRSALGLG